MCDDAHSTLVSDCEAAHRQGLDTLDKVETADTNALTLQDLEAVSLGRQLPKYDAIILHGEDEEDQAFAWHLAERLEMAGKTVRLRFACLACNVQQFEEGGGGNRWQMTRCVSSREEWKERESYYVLSVE